MDSNLADPLFCFPDIVRFSWAPAKNALENKGIHCEWEADQDEEEEKKDSDGIKRQQMQLNSFIIGGPKAKTKKTVMTKKPRLGYFEQTGLESIVKLHDG